MQTEKDIAMQKINRLLSTIPKSFPTWSVQRSIDFKETCRRCQSVIAKQRRKEGELESALHDLQSFYTN